jgi:hypothetical protein
MFIRGRREGKKHRTREYSDVFGATDYAGALWKGLYK